MGKNTLKAAGGAVLVVMSLLINIVPASAAGVGVTTGGFSTISGTGSGLPTCLKTSATPSIQLSNVGSVQVGTGAYAGASTATFNLDGPFYFNPAATYGGDGICDVPGTTPVASGGLSGTSPTGSVNCTWTGGLGYARVGNVYTITVNGTCVITGASPGSGPVTFEFTGNQNPCLPVVNNCEGTLNNTEFGPGAYAQV